MSFTSHADYKNILHSIYAIYRSQSHLEPFTELRGIILIQKLVFH